MFLNPRRSRLVFPIAAFCIGSFLLPAVSHSQVTSKNNKRLRDALRDYPQADTNKDGVLTQKEGLAFLQKMKRQRQGRNQQAAVPITHKDIRYGQYNRNALDLWLAESDKPTPLLICIHGGGFSGGDKSSFYRSPIVKKMLDAGISVATINYRLTEGGKNPYPIPMHDSARAVQFLRHNASKYNLNKTRFAATGGSAGGTITLWLGFHDDLADKDNDDPVLRESTRLIACAPNAAQPSVHLPTLLKWFDVESLVEHGGGRPLFGIKDNGELEMTKKLDRISRDASPITHLTQDDPPVFFSAGNYKKVSKDMSANAWVHHPIMGIRLKESMDKIGVESHVQYSGGPKVEAYENSAEFIIRKLNLSK